MILTTHTVFNTPLIRHFFRWLSRLGIKLSGWTLSGESPTENKYVLIAAPHTSNWDFVLVMAMAFCYNVHLSWMGKDTLFKGPFGPIMRWMGGIPVDRSTNTGLVQQLAERFNNEEELVVAIPPEGTRSKVTVWKSGFYHTARSANVPIALGFLDFSKKRGGFGPLFYTTGDYEKDLSEIQAFYQNITGKTPSRF